MLLFDWYIVDPIISLIVALLILRSGWRIFKQSLHILIEGTPITVNKEEVAIILTKIEGVKDVHDLHIWTITSGLDSLTCHLLIEEKVDEQVVLQEAINIGYSDYSVEYPKYNT